jgi:hypothetical protein
MGEGEIESNEATLRFVGVAAYALPRDWIRSFASLVALGILESPRLLPLDASQKGASHNQISSLGSTTFASKSEFVGIILHGYSCNQIRSEDM